MNTKSQNLLLLLTIVLISCGKAADTSNKDNRSPEGIEVETTRIVTGQEAEAARLAAEEQKAEQAEEATRLAEEAAARLAAEKEAEAERAKAEAAKLAAEKEAEAERAEEVARLAAEQAEAERAEEAARLAAEQEVARLDKEQKAKEAIINQIEKLEKKEKVLKNLLESEVLNPTDKEEYSKQLEENTEELNKAIKAKNTINQISKNRTEVENQQSASPRRKNKKLIKDKQSAIENLQIKLSNLSIDNK